MNGIVIYETSFQVSNLTEYALPLSEICFEINSILFDEKWQYLRIVEEWRDEEIEKEKGNMSWTQFAINRCHHFLN